MWVLLWKRWLLLQLLLLLLEVVLLWLLRVLLRWVLRVVGVMIVRWHPTLWHSTPHPTVPVRWCVLLLLLLQRRRVLLRGHPPLRRWDEHPTDPPGGMTPL